jgi:uncharacterized tellurite resistance protein B-like protein
VHIILAFLGVVVTILVLLSRLQENGIDIGWLNPFSWHRRRKYRNHHDLNPAFKLESPMEVAALYMVAVAKVDGDISREQKERIIALFQTEFHLTSDEARGLLGSSVHLLGQTQEVFNTPHKVIERCYDKISPEQAESICHLLNEVAKVEGTNSQAQEKLVANIKKACPQIKGGKW